MGRGGEIYALDMGELDQYMADWRVISSVCPDSARKKSDIVYTGLRPGEKLYEELVAAGENYVPTIHPKLRMAKPLSPMNG